jgi:hypothetical protein
LNTQAISLTTVLPLNNVKLDVPTAPDQVTSNGCPAVRPFNDPVNASAAADPRIVNADKKHNCRANSSREKGFILKIEDEMPRQGNKQIDLIARTATQNR